jgi:hypothetical protein
MPSRSLNLWSSRYPGRLAGQRPATAAPTTQVARARELQLLW